jgi:hypothetical protein
MKASLKDFDPDYVGAIESKMWQAYYCRRFFKLFILLIKLLRAQFHLGYILSIRAAYYAAFAAALFSIQKGKEDEKRMLKKLEELYKIVADNSVESFDYKKAAELELNWWLVDRYPDRYSITREEAVVSLPAFLYTIDPVKLKEHAQYRAQAMVLDRSQAMAVKNKSRTARTLKDWEEITVLLKKSYISLYHAVNV